jgi:hypothetical protein
MRYAVRALDAPGWSATPPLPSWGAAVEYQQRAMSATTLTDAPPPIPASRADLAAMAESAHVLVTRLYQLTRPDRPLTATERAERRATAHQSRDALLWLLARSPDDHHRRLARLHKD